MLVEITNPVLADNYGRWIKNVGDVDPYKGPLTVGITDVLRAHFLVLDFFSNAGMEGFGGIGPRDINLLHSALSRQHISFGGAQKFTEGLDLCATLFYGLINNHPFHDANKRTALLVALYHLHLLGRCSGHNLRQTELDELAVNTADHKLYQYAGFSKIARRFPADPEVMFLSDWLRRNTRRIDKKSYTVTYNELDVLLKRFHCRLANPNGNYIDVMKRQTETYRQFLIFPRSRTVEKKVAQIGFPGWKKQVNDSAIKTVRKECGLTPENGIDSQVFFKGADVMEALIDKFSGPLRRLANK